MTNTYSRRELAEDVPLTKEYSGRFQFRCYGDNGLKITIISFTVLSIGITIALGLQIFYEDNLSQSNQHGAVATDDKECSEIGTSILRRGGNAVDAAIASTICIMVVNPHKTGLGGGGYAMVYSHEVQNKPIIIDFSRNTVAGAFGQLNLRLPAALRGLEVTHKLRGKLPWDQLVSPSARLAREGFIVAKEFAHEIERDENFLPLYGRLEPGQKLTLPMLSKTLDIVAKHGPAEFYNGTLSPNVSQNSSQILKQLASYQPRVTEAKVMFFYDHSIYYQPDASALEHALKKINDLQIQHEAASTLESQTLVANALINTYFMYSKNGINDSLSKFSSIVAMDGRDSYVIIITGLSKALGSARMTDAGFLMDSTENTLEKLIPVLFRDTASVCGLRGIFGTDDVTLTSEIFYNLIVRRLNVSAAIENPRYYLMTDGICIENDHLHSMEPTFQARLRTMVNLSTRNIDQVQKSCNSIVKIEDTMSSHSDSRGGGLAARFR